MFVAPFLKTFIPNWINGKPLVVEPYRMKMLSEFFDTRDPDGCLHHNILLDGEAKKNGKTLGLILGASIALVADDSPGGNECYIVANDEDQAGDDLALLKKLIGANPLLDANLLVKTKIVERRDGKGFIEILPADVAGSHGKTYRFCGFDEIHGYRDWSLLEALQLDPTRPDAQMYITSYASIHHKPGAPLYDLFQIGKLGKDPRMLFAWYAADYCTDPALANASPEDKANPARSSWADKDYLEQQAKRLPGHKYRRLHLNLPGAPEGAAFQAEMVMDAVARGITSRPPQDQTVYSAAVDMSGGSIDDATLAIAHTDADGKAILDRVLNQGPRPPFDPRDAVARFANVLHEYGVKQIGMDRYAGLTFVSCFAELGIRANVAELTASEAYEALEVPLNGKRVVLLDVPTLEQQLLGLMWRGGKIDHPNGEHDDWACATAHAIHAALERAKGPKSFHLPAVSVVRPTPGGEIVARLRRDPDADVWRNFGNRRETYRDPRFS